MSGPSNKDKTHCKHGHEFTEENTRIRPRDGARECIACKKIRQAAKRKHPEGWTREKKTHCKHGHPLDEENTYINPTSGARSCRTCMKARRENGTDFGRNIPARILSYCRRGHSLENALIVKEGKWKGYRNCRECHNMRQRRSHALRVARQKEEQLMAEIESFEACQGVEHYDEARRSPSNLSVPSCRFSGRECLERG